MFGMGAGELLVVLVVVLVVFGPGRLPEVMGSLGKGMQEFKTGLRPTEDGVLLLLFRVLRSGQITLRRIDGRVGNRIRHTYSVHAGNWPGHQPVRCLFLLF